MANKQHSPEQAVAKLRQIDVLLVGEGESIQQTCKEDGITDVTYYRWRRWCDIRTRDQRIKS
jgi:putative transposase